MYKKFKKGTTELIQGLEINIPPVGYVPDHYSGTQELIKVDILFEDKPKKQQKWERQPLPGDYNSKRQKEINAQKLNPNYKDDYLTSYKKREWMRRLNGIWFMCNGKPVYITGLHYFYMNWWRLDDCYPAFRENDRKFFYFRQYCIEDPECAGSIEVTKRKQGKSYRAGCDMYEYTSRTKGTWGGIQSKTDADAERQMFSNSIVNPFKYLPDFFKPFYDTQKGAAPKKELVFSYTAEKGKNASIQSFEGELGSRIDFRASNHNSYDGPKLHRYIRDEFGKKSEKCDLLELLPMVKECIMKDGRYIGKMYWTSTIEHDEKDKSHEDPAAKKIWDGSDQSRKANGRTETGMYRYFTPAYETLYWDDYGYPLVDEAKKYYEEERKRLSKDPKSLAAFIRKNPFSIEEAFMSDSDQCPFSVMVLQNVLNYCENLPPGHDEIEIRVDIIWKNRDMEAMWVPNDTNGKWYFSYIPPKDHINKVNDPCMSNEFRYEPLNDERFALGTDPVAHGIEAEYGASKASAVCFRKFDIHHKEDRSDTFIADYLFDPDNPEDYYEDMIVACFFFGCKIHIEKQKFDIYNYFKNRGYRHFVMNRPSNTVEETTKGTLISPGTPAGTSIINLWIDRLKTFWATKGHKVRNKRIIMDALAFRYATRTQRDITTAAGFCILAAEAPYEPKADLMPISKLMSLLPK